MSMLISDVLSEIIASTSSAFLVDPILVRAICIKESGLISWRTRFEPAWRYFVTPESFAGQLGITPETEKVHQQTSWGLMQLMGSVAREIGFDGHLTQLCDPEVGVHFGVKKIMEIQKRYQSLDDIIAAYNAGTAIKHGDQYMNQGYVDGVLRNMKSLSDDRPRTV